MTHRKIACHTLKYKRRMSLYDGCDMGCHYGAGWSTHLCSSGATEEQNLKVRLCYCASCGGSGAGGLLCPYSSPPQQVMSLASFMAQV